MTAQPAGGFAIGANTGIGDDGIRARSASEDAIIARLSFVGPFFCSSAYGLLVQVGD
jgi:hypothetical protein